MMDKWWLCIWWFGVQLIGGLFVLLYFVFVIVIFVYLFVFVVYIVFYDYFFIVLGIEVDWFFVGFDNFVMVLIDLCVLGFFCNMLIFLVINVLLMVVFVFVFVVVLNIGICWVVVYWVVFYVLYLMVSVLFVGVWMLLFLGNGLVNMIFGFLVLDLLWFVNSGFVMLMIVLYVIWKQFGFYILLYLVVLQNVFKEFYELVEIDGVGVFLCFWNVMVFGVCSVIMLVLIFLIIMGVNLFMEFYLFINGGGLDGVFIILVLFIYQLGIQQQNFDIVVVIGMIFVIFVGMLLFVVNCVMRE